MNADAGSRGPASPAAQGDPSGGPAQPGEQSLSALVGDWLTVPEVADRLGLDANRARGLLREREVIGYRPPERGVLCVPAAFFLGGAVVRGLPGTLVLLADAGYSDAEALRWLFTPDDSLPGSPVQALRENRGTEVRRRAQALGF